MDTKGVVNLNYVVHLVLMDLDDYSLVNYKKFLQYAILAYTDLNINILQSVKVGYLPVNANNKTADLPDDFIDYTKIGFNDGGEFKTLSLNKSLMLTNEKDDCGNDINSNYGEGSNDYFPYTLYYAPHFRDGQFIGELYGGAGGVNTDGSYRIDLDKRKICLSSEVSATTLILEYKSSGISKDGTTSIPRQCVESIRAYIHWKRKEYNDKVAQSDKERLKNNYYIEYEKLKDLEMSFTIEEYYDSRRTTYQQSPKR